MTFLALGLVGGYARRWRRRDPDGQVCVFAVEHGPTWVTRTAYGVFLACVAATLPGVPEEKAYWMVQAAARDQHHRLETALQSGTVR